MRKPFLKLIVFGFAIWSGGSRLFSDTGNASLLQSFLQVKEAQLAGGYSLTSKSDFTKENESLFSASGKYAAPFVALTFWIGRPDLQLGLSGQYVRGYSLEIPAGYAVSSLTMTTYSGHLHLRYFIFHGLYAGIAAGLASTQVRYDGSIGKISGFHPLLSLRVGYDHEFLGYLIAGIYVDVAYRIQSVTADLGNGSKKYTGDAFVFQPAILIGYRF